VCVCVCACVCVCVCVYIYIRIHSHVVTSNNVIHNLGNLQATEQSRMLISKIPFSPEI
jgi:hypothetical protein